MVIPVQFTFRSITVIAIIMIIMMIVYMQMNSKKKTEYTATTGQITYLDQQFEQWPPRNLGKYRYLKIEGYEYPFQIFVGKDAGDFKPKMEQIDLLKVGDTVTVFYYELEDTRKIGVNNFAQFIEKDNQPYFERGDSAKTMGIVVIVLAGLLIIGGFCLWKWGKIAF